MRFLRVVFACLVVICGLSAGLLGGVAVWTAIAESSGTPDRLKALLLGAFGFWCGVFMLVIAQQLGALGSWGRIGERISTNGFHKGLLFVFGVLLLLAIPIFGQLYLLTVLLLVVVGGFLLMALHDFGHIVAAFLVGLRPVEIDVGTGLEYFSFRLGKIRFSIRQYIFSGYLLLASGSGRFTRWKRLVVALGGPMATVLGFFAGKSAYAFLAPGIAELSGLPAGVFAAIFVVQNALIFFGVFGYQITIDGKILKSDLTVALLSLFGSDQIWEAPPDGIGQCREHIERGEWREAWMVSGGRWRTDPSGAQLFAAFATYAGREACAVLEPLVEEVLLKSNPDAGQRAWLLFTKGACLAQAKPGSIASRCFSDALASAPDVTTKVAICESVANLVICARLMECLPDAIRLSESALQLQPEEITLKGTYGSLLVEMGRIEEGAAMLEGVFRETQSENDKTICAFYLAVVSLRKGEPQSVPSWIEKMKLHNPPKWLLERLGELDS